MLALYAEIDVLCVLLLVTFIVKILQKGTGRKFTLTFFVYLSAILGGCFDFFSQFVNGRTDFPIWLSYFSNAFYFIMVAVCAFLWLCYTEAELGHDVSNKKKWLVVLLCIPITVMMALSISTYWTHFVFYIDEAHIYHRGPFSIWQAVITYLYIGIPSFHALYRGIKATDPDEKKRDFALSAFIIPPILTGFLQLYIQESPSLTIGIAMSLTLIYINVENESHTRQMEVISALTGDFDNVYYLDLENNKFTQYRLYGQEASAQQMDSYMSFDLITLRDKLVDDNVCEEDRDMVREQMTAENIFKELSTKPAFILNYRVERDGKRYYFQTKVVKSTRGDKTIIVGTHNIEDNMRREHEQRRKMEEMLKEVQDREKLLERNHEIIQILASEYESVYYVDLETSDMTIFTMSESVQTIFGDVFGEHINFSAALTMYLKSQVRNSDIATLRSYGSVEFLKEKLRDTKSHTFTYRVGDEDNFIYHELKLVKVNAENEEATALVLGIADRDEQIRDAEERQRHLQQNYDIIKGLASEYSSVYYIDLETDELTPYVLNDATENALGNIFRSGIGFESAYQLYVNSLVYGADKKMMLSAGSSESIKKNLSGSKKTYVTSYRSDNGGNPRYCEMKFVKVGNEDIPTAVALGFSDKDEEIRRDQESRKILEQNFEIIQILASEYSSVYYIDLETEALTPYSMNDDTEHNFGGVFRSGIKFSDAYDMYVDKLIYEDDKYMMLKAGSLKNIRRELSDKKTFITTYRSDNDGSPHYCEMKFVKVGDEETPTAVALGFADKDEEIRKEQARQKQLEDALLAAKAANAAKSTFLFNMSHDIRTPMNAILGFTSMAEKYIDNKEKVADCLGKVKLSGEHLLNLINDVLNMARIESGKVVIEEEPANVRECARDLIMIVQETAKQNSITLGLDMSTVTVENVYADTLRVNQVMLNIIGNAIKYTKPGGKVNYTIFQLPQTTPEEITYKFIVEDTGIGMSKEYCDHVFEAFTREKSSTVNGIQGTGLGMAITKQLLELMGGSINVESELGVGTKVTVMLTFRVAQEKAANTEADLEKAASLKMSLEGKRVLLVEDNELNREIARDILEDEGLIVDEADDGTVAVEKMGKAQPGDYDFVLMDIQMPHMDGYKATELIRQLDNKEVAAVPIIAMTANAFDEDKQRAMDAGMNAHIAKPIEIDKLFETMSEFAK